MPARTYMKRKRQPQWTAQYGKRRRGARGRIAPRQRGFARTSGFYGRYAPSGGEMKFHDIDVDDAVIAQNGVIQNTGTINIIPQGVTEVQRVGRKCNVHRIMWKYNLTLAASATVGAVDTVRMILYQDTQCNGATAAVTDIMESDNYQTFRNLANSGRFNILYDKMHQMNPMASAGNGTANDAAPWALNRTFYKKCNIPLEFDSTTGALTEIRSNNLGILTFSKNGAVSILDSKIRLRFSDR